MDANIFLQTNQGGSLVYHQFRKKLHIINTKCWRRRRDLKGFAPTRKHSRLVRERVAHARYSLFSPLSRSLHPPQAAVALQALAGEPARFKSPLLRQKKKQDRPIGLSCFLAEKERFEFVCRRPIRLICLRKQIKWAK